MTYKEYKRISEYELFHGKKYSFFERISIKHFRPNTNCMFLARKMWYLYSCGGLRRKISRLYYLRIMHRFGCCIYRNIEVGVGFWINHPVGIVIGKCSIGNNFHIYQNASIGVKHSGDEAKGLTPKIGNNVRLFAGSAIFGNVSIVDDVTVGANSLVISNISEPGTYVGCPCKRI